MYDPNKLIQILTTPEYRCIDGNGNCFPPSNTMYKKISEKNERNRVVYKSETCIYYIKYR